MLEKKFLIKLGNIWALCFQLFRTVRIDEHRQNGLTNGIFSIIRTAMQKDGFAMRFSDLDKQGAE